MKIHPLCLVFPPLNKEELNALAADIGKNGLREPISLFHGQVLDGRNRLEACEIAGIEPRYLDLPEDTDPSAFVISKNLSRRHLSPTQRATVAAQLANLEKGRPAENASIEAISQESAAAMMNVSRASVQRAAYVLKHGVPELIKAVDDGTIALGAARQIATLPASRQRDQLKNGSNQAPKSKVARPAPPPTISDPDPVRPSAPAAIRTFADRIEKCVRADIDFALSHELSTISSWSEAERRQAHQKLITLRDELSKLIASLEIGDA